MTTNIIKTDRYSIFATAHAEARRLRENWPGVAYKTLFRDALARCYKAVRDLNRKIAYCTREACWYGLKSFGQLFRKFAIKAVLRAKRAAEAAAPKTVEKKLLDLGCKVWDRKGRRIYISRVVSKVIANYSDLNEHGQYRCDRTYYDCIAKEWCDLPTNAQIAEEFAA